MKTYRMPWTDARREATILLDLNEFDADHHPAVLEALAQADACRYPDPHLADVLLGRERW